jgi:septal ring factor EnvC (AmiA/AmiB activator)
MGMQGEAVYKGFPIIDEGQEYWWVQLHLYKNKEDDHKKMGLWMFTNFEMHTSFFDSARCVAWSAIKELGERLKWRLHNTQKDLKEEKEDTTALKETISQLQSDMVQLAFELTILGDLITTKDDQIADSKKQIDQNNGST